MISLIMLLSSSCPETKMVNRTEFPWNDFDRQTLARAKKRCGELYENSPCVKLFIKRTANDYSVLCGRAKDE